MSCAGNRPMAKAAFLLTLASPITWQFWGPDWKLYLRPWSKLGCKKVWDLQTIVLRFGHRNWDPVRNKTIVATISPDLLLLSPRGAQIYVISIPAESRFWAMSLFLNEMVCDGDRCWPLFCFLQIKLVYNQLLFASCRSFLSHQTKLATFTRVYQHTSFKILWMGCR